MSKKTFIYGLQCPITEQIRYIGKSNNPKKRYWNHLIDKKNYHRNRWINKLKNSGLKPILVIIDEVDESIWKEAEIKYIRLFKSFGADLVNTTEGGDDTPDSKGEKNKSNFSGCDGLKGNETMGDMCNHLHSEHENAEKEIRKILSLNNNDECSRKLINVWSKEINHHFGEEERVVFPAMLKKNKSFEPEIKKLLEEHKYFYKVIDEIKNKNCSNCGNLPKDFCKKLLNHIEKEEKLFNDFKK